MDFPGDGGGEDPFQSFLENRCGKSIDRQSCYGDLLDPRPHNIGVSKPVDKEGSNEWAVLFASGR